MRTVIRNLNISLMIVQRRKLQQQEISITHVNRTSVTGVFVFV